MTGSGGLSRYLPTRNVSTIVNQSVPTYLLTSLYERILQVGERCPQGSGREEGMMQK